ncbi:unnamed protein product, partial [Mesorhabditis spiculigera]
MKRLLILISLLLADSLANVSGNGAAWDLPCDDYHEISRSSLEQPIQFNQLTLAGGHRKDKLRLYEAKGLYYEWYAYRTRKVVGTEFEVDEVLSLFQDNNCASVPWGETVRELVIRHHPEAEPNTLTSEVLCSLEYLSSLCSERIGAAACRLVNDTDSAARLLVGDPLQLDKNQNEASVMEFYEWGALRAEMAYTSDTLGLYEDQDGKLAIVDPTGRGFRHVCKRIIQPISNDWGNWEKMGIPGEERVFRFFLLHAIGFVHPERDSEFERFIVAQMAGKKVDRKVVQAGYCQQILEGAFSSTIGGPSTCHTEPLDNDFMRNRKAKMFKESAKRLLGPNSSGWDLIEKDLEEMELIFVSRKVVQRLRYSSPADLIAAKNRVANPGKTLVVDGKKIFVQPIKQHGDSRESLSHEIPYDSIEDGNWLDETGIMEMGIAGPCWESLPFFAISSLVFWLF